MESHRRERKNSPKLEPIKIPFKDALKAMLQTPRPEEAKRDKSKIKKAAT